MIIETLVGLLAVVVVAGLSYCLGAWIIWFDTKYTRWLMVKNKFAVGLGAILLLLLAILFVQLLGYSIMELFRK